MLATYTITQNGLANGNVIAQPFTVEVTKMIYQDDDYKTQLVITSCCKNQADQHCGNDDIAEVLNFDLPAMGSSKNADLTATFEIALTTAYGGNWSKN